MRIMIRIKCLKKIQLKKEMIVLLVGKNYPFPIDCDNKHLKSMVRRRGCEVYRTALCRDST